MLNSSTGNARTFAALLLGLAAGPYYYGWVHQSEATSVSAQEFVLVDERGTKMAVWTAVDGHPRLEFLGRDEKSALTLGMHTPDNANPMFPSQSEPHLSFYETRNPQHSSQVAMALKKSGNQVRQTFYNVQANGSSPEIVLQSGAYNNRKTNGAHATFAGPGSEMLMLDFEPSGELKVLLGGGKTGKGATYTFSAEGTLQMGRDGLEKVVDLFK